MQKSSKAPKELRPYIFQGVTFDSEEEEEAIADCPFCGEVGKFNVNTETSLFKCWHGDCQESGNATTFMRKYWEKAYSETTGMEYRRFADECGFMGTKSLITMGCAMSPLKSQWLVPAFNDKEEITGLYRFGRVKKGDKWVDKLMISPGYGVHLLNRQNISDTQTIYLTEGWRDALAWMEQVDDDVVSLPGSGAFRHQWSRLFADKVVILLFDNDNSGITGVKSTASILASSKNPPKEIKYIKWGVEHKTDVRDYLNE